LYCLVFIAVAVATWYLVAGRDGMSGGETERTRAAQHAHIFSFFLSSALRISLHSFGTDLVELHGVVVYDSVHCILFRCISMRFIFNSLGCALF
jgi:hypothetical protein